MKYRVLGKTGIKVSEIGVGAWQLGGPLKLDGIVDGHPELGPDFCINLIRQCGDLGINFIDTAEQYGNGESERRVGEALRGQRDKWILATKFGNQVGPRGERLKDASPKRVPVSLEGSLKRLQTDHIDVYFYHISPKQEEAADVARVLESFKKKGQVRAVGMSGNNLADLELLHSVKCLDVVQFHTNMIQPEDALRAFLAKHDVGGVVRGAFAGGRLTGKYFRQPPRFSSDDIRSRAMKPEAAAAEYARYAVFEELLSPQRNMVQLALRYLLDEPTTHTIIPGGKGIEDYHNAIRAVDQPPLTAAQRQRIAQLREQIAAASA